ncbi:lysoplasmalogenase TMEM86A-like [Ptychodera flava]|uniref:lysoplasmalogenase TMEM86A-like n=1 Tax=Ptychodera flava TaxID=63121 RepID=UPI00396A3442
MRAQAEGQSIDPKAKGGVYAVRKHNKKDRILKVPMLSHMFKSSFFFLAVALYFSLEDSIPTPSQEAVFIKILPIVSLAAFVVLHSLASGKLANFSVGILCGLVLSGIGDYYLVYKTTHFLHGLASFAVAQLIYAVTFGLRPFKPVILLVCSVVALSMYTYLFPGLKGIHVVSIFIYMIVIYYMAWRALARCQFVEGNWTWGQLLCALGSVSFLISDFVIGVDLFRYDVPHRSFIVMVTYYLAQFGITMAVTDYPSMDEIKMKKAK